MILSRCSSIVLFLALTGAAAAQTAEEQTFPQTSQDAGLSFGIVAGGLAFIGPVYEGSDKYRVTGFPLIYPKFYSDNQDGPGLGDRLTLRSADDVRFAVLQHNGFEIGPVAGYNFGRDEDDADLLRGLGDVDDGLVLGGYAGYNFEPFFVDAAYVRQITGESDAGYQVKIAAGAESRLTERLDLTTTVSTTYASDDYMDTYFAISPTQSANSGLNRYEADGGFKSVGLDVALKFQVNERAALTSSAGYSRLVGDAADSPVTASRDQFRGGIGFTYIFGRAR